MAATGIDALFVPIASADEIPIVSSQIKYFNIQAQMLGTGDWNDVAMLDLNRQYTDGIVFFADSSPDVTGEPVQNFCGEVSISE